MRKNKYNEFLDTLPVKDVKGLIKESRAANIIVPPADDIDNFNISESKKILLESLLNEPEIIEAALMSKNYLEFVKGAWHTLEPGEPFIVGWHIEAICDVMQAIGNGEINNVIINIPPRMSKSRLTNSFLIPWLWTRFPWIRAISASYAYGLSVNFSKEARTVLSSDWYRRRWGQRFFIKSYTDSQIVNDCTGFRLVSSVGGSVTGRGGHILLADDLLEAKNRESKVEREKANSWYINVFSNRVEGDPEKARRVVIMQRLHSLDLTGALLEMGGYYHICYDAETEILSEEGWKKFSDLRPGIKVMGVSTSDLAGSWQIPTDYISYFYTGDMHKYKSMTCDLLVTPDHRMIYKDFNHWKTDKHKNWNIKQAKELPNHFYIPQAIQWEASADDIEFAGRIWSQELLGEFLGWYLSEGCASGKSATTRIVQKKSSKYYNEIDDLCKRVAILLNKNVGIYDHGQSGDCTVWSIFDKNLAITLERTGKNAFQKHLPPKLKNLSRVFFKHLLLSYTKGDGHFTKRNSGKSFTITSRSKIMMDDLQECCVKLGWASSVREFEISPSNFNNHVLPRGVMYKLTVRTSRTKGRDKKWYTRVTKTNVSKEKYTGKVYCVSVPSGAVLVRRNGIISVSGNCLPMEYDPSRKCRVFIRDRNTGNRKLLIEDPRMVKGELLQPNRFTREYLEINEKVKGNFYWCVPKDAPILMSDFTYKNIEDIKVGDTVVGFTKVTKDWRRKLCPSKVKNIYTYIAPLNKVCLESGKAVYCTEEHKWFSGRSGVDTHKEYYKAKVGRSLGFVSDPSIQPPQTLEDCTKAGWLAGFFDGEGSCTTVEYRGKNKFGSITYTQGLNNIELCNKLEEYLNHFGITWSLHERKASNSDTNIRMYRIKTRSLDDKRLFWLTVNPTKWKQRFFDSTYQAGGNFVQDWDEIVSIEPCGRKKVYALETETGNYIAYGYASSNSGQFQQDPVPEGGGLIKTIWFLNNKYKETPEEIYNICTKTISSWDLSFKDTSESDFVVGQVWGKLGQQIYLIDQVRGKFSFTATLSAINMLSAKWPRCQEKLIEDKANGPAIISTLKNKIQGIIPVNPQGDKIERLSAVSWLIEAGNVHIPDPDIYQWVQEYVNELCRFPGAPNDDMADATSQALYRLQSIPMFSEYAPTGVGTGAKFQKPWNVGQTREQSPWARNWGYRGR